MRFDDTKEEETIIELNFPDDKNAYITVDDQVHHVRNHVGNSPPIDRCNHEEADTRVYKMTNDNSTRISRME